MHAATTSSREPSGSRQRGFTLAELMTVVAISSILLVAIGVVWQSRRGRSEATAAARMATALVHQARMNSIYEGMNHFLVFDPNRNVIEIYDDSGTTAGSFDDDDQRVGGTHISSGVEIALPLSPALLTSPLDTTTVSSAWSLPSPDSGARWGTQLRGFMTTPQGLIRSAEATPQTISGGVIVFSSGREHASAVGLRGIEGAVRSFELYKGQWKEL